MMQFNDFQLLKWEDKKKPMSFKAVSFKEAEYVEWVEFEVWKVMLNIRVVLLEDA